MSKNWNGCLIFLCLSLLMLTLHQMTFEAISLSQTQFQDRNEIMIVLLESCRLNRGVRWS